jgi:hypothetical protein
MTEEKLLKELYKVQNQMIGWMAVGLAVGLILGWTAGITIGEMQHESLSASNAASSSQRVFEVDRSDLGSAKSTVDIAR